ncbi:hypothetical protein [Undibacterium curvum]|uniref:ABC-2 type transport system permease protein n=1 Tax=Undibacterium curvum TaxID=2762294 RepID=A0ABR7A4L6_9BURK|nr:hypothetical protein [Undibacterium curvum]MBC3931840.1 hypothetical protein [Undibacterium curvum]
MKACWWLLKREFWEHRRALLITLGTLLLVCIVFNAWALNVDLLTTHIQSRVLPRLGIDKTTEEFVAYAVLQTWLYAQRLLFEVTGFIFCFRYFLLTLGAERTEKNVMFWRSLPVTDMQTVFVKLVFGTTVIPLFFLLANLCATLVSVLLHAAYFSRQFNLEISTADFLESGMTLYSSSMISFPVFILWGGLTGGWLMLWSALTPRLGGLFAILIPLLGLVVVTQTHLSYPDAEFWLKPVATFLTSLDLSLLPGSLNAKLLWFEGGWDWDNYLRGVMIHHVHQQPDLIKQFINRNLWISVVVGSIFTICAAHLRRFKSE